MAEQDERCVERVTFRWADIDANFHVRHSVYYDLGSQQRINTLGAHGLTMDVMQQGGFGPVLFREECRFFKEVKLQDRIDIVARVRTLGRDFRKFGFEHEFLRDGERCALVQVDGAWFNSVERRIFVPPPVVIDAMNAFPRSDDFAWV